MDLTREFGLETVKYRKENRIAYVTLNRPDKPNPLSYATVSELLQCWEDLHGDPVAWAAILSGEGKSFCSGWDQNLEEDELKKAPSAPRASSSATWTG